MLVMLAAVVFLCVTLPIVWFTMPIFNRMFSLIWEDPRDREAREAMKRLKDLHIDGHMPEETALLIAASEKGATERELLDAMGAVSAKDAIAAMTGKRSLLGGFLNGIGKATRKR